jgi:uncharacterized membrane protein YphA (DoxX/SURF4 family)
MWCQCSPKSRDILYTISRIVLGGVFVYASWDKILDPVAFAQMIINYQIVSSSTANLSAVFLPWLELVCGICLIINRWPRGSAFIAAGLMVVFMGALGYNIYRGLDVSCGCFTLTEEAPGNMWLYMLRDVLFLGMAIGIVLYGRTSSAKPNLSGWT